MPVESGVDGLPVSQGTLGGTVRSISTSISPTRLGWAEAGDVGGEFLAVESWFEEVRTGLFPGGRRIRTSGPTFKEDSVRRARPFVFWCPAAIVLTSENTDFELPASRSNLARRTT
jgi:hypothetical protein